MENKQTMFIKMDVYQNNLNNICKLKKHVIQW